MLLSPGAGKSRTTLTTIAEHLASKGYVVAGIDHAFEAYNVEFPGGRLLQYLGCQAAGQPWPQALQNRVTDVSFVLNAVLRDRSLRVDATRIAMAGHTAGGGAAALAMVTDDRIKAGVSLDGPIYRPITLGKSLALLTSPIGEQQFGAGWDATWPGLTGWTERRHLPGTGHSSSTDNGYLTVRLGQKDKVPPATWQKQYGTDDPVEAMRFFRDYVTGFLQDRL